MDLYFSDKTKKKPTWHEKTVIYYTGVGAKDFTINSLKTKAGVIVSLGNLKALTIVVSHE